MTPLPRTAAILVALLAGCATLHPDFEEGRRLVDAGRLEDGLKFVENAVRAEPRNPEYRIYLANQRSAQAMRLTALGDTAARGGDFADAEIAYRRALAIDPGSARAAAGLMQIDVERRNRARLADATAALGRKDLARAETLVREALNDDPRSAAARDLLGRVQGARADAERPAPMAAGFNRPVSIEFRDTTLRAAFEILSRTTSINFVFDRDVRTDTKVTFFVRNARVEDVIRMLLATQQLGYKALNENSLLIYPQTVAKLKDYQDLVVRSFYLGNADAKQTLNLLRSVIKTRDAFVDEKLNLLIVRDTPEAMAVAERLIAAHDLPEPEVLLEVEVLEVKRARLQDMGIQWPNTLTALNIVPNSATTTTTGGVVVTTNPTTTTTSQLTLRTLRGLDSSQIGLSPNPQITARDDASDVNLLANPRIRVKNREKARIHIGDRVPVITTTATANVGVSESVSYLDVGLKLDVEPNIFLHQDVGIKVGLEVSSIVREVRSNNGALTYQLGTRNAATSLRVKDGETQVLAGLISDEERKSANRVPGLGLLPLVGLLFGNQRDDATKTEIILLITPRVVRSVTPGPGHQAQFGAGTESVPGARPLGTAPGSRAGLAPSTGPVKPGPAKPEPLRPEPAPLEPEKPAPADPAPAAAPGAPAAPAAPAKPAAQ